MLETRGFLGCSGADRALGGWGRIPCSTGRTVAAISHGGEQPAGWTGRVKEVEEGAEPTGIREAGLYNGISHPSE